MEHGKLASCLLSTIVQLLYLHYRYYVKTEEPPITTWNHPLGPAQPERKTYAPPAVPPPNNNSSTYAGGQGGGNGYPQPLGGYGGYGDSGGAEYYPQQNDSNQRGLGRYYRYYALLRNFIITID